ncbi:MAG: methyltransferase [Flavobacteriaceae bacterium]|nr:methyltransferase [Flavobacteriaceae bacterium]
MHRPFRFKQFQVAQERTAMKVGTDGVLLGAWTEISEADSILDIGAGTGLIALMLAQRSTAETIDALEIDPDAFEQCVENFEASPWGDRLFCYHAALQEFVGEIDDSFDLIVSNPPFYSEGMSSGDARRDQARQNDFLPFDVLIAGAAQLLAPQGSFAVVVPYSEYESFVALAEAMKLYPNRVTHVKGNPDVPFKRSLLQFSRTKMPLEPAELIIETERHRYTEAYSGLTRDFYLKM